MSKVYLAGPMRGYPRYNFDAFDNAAAVWRAEGHDVFSPAERDRAMGFDPSGPIPDGFLRQALAADLAEVCKADIVAVLPGWERSKGARLELGVALQLDPPPPIYDAETMHELRRGFVADVLASPIEQYDCNTSILDEAKRITSGARNMDYGHPREDFTRTARLWTALLQHKLKPIEAILADDIAMCMIALKLSRQVHSHKRDNLVDIAGYTRTLAILSGEDWLPPKDE